MKRAQQDANAKEIVANLRAMGVSVEYASATHRAGLPDLACGWRGRSHLLELKVLGGHLRPSQVEFSRRWNGCMHVATSSVEAFALIRECHDREPWRGER